MEYSITWTIDIDANTPKQAAEACLKIMQDKDSIANVFDVQDVEIGKIYEVDLLKDIVVNVTPEPEPEPALSLYLVTHSHRHGVSSYLIKSDHFPIIEEVVEHFGIEYEEDGEEDIDINSYDDIDILKSSETAK